MLSEQLRGALGEDKVNEQASEMKSMLLAAYKKGGYAEMSMLAYKIEAGVELKDVANRKILLRDVLGELGRTLPLKKNEKSLLNMYRNDLR